MGEMPVLVTVRQMPPKLSRRRSAVYWRPVCGSLNLSSRLSTTQGVEPLQARHRDDPGVDPFADQLGRRGHSQLYLRPRRDDHEVRLQFGELRHAFLSRSRGIHMDMSCRQMALSPLEKVGFRIDN